MSPTSFSEEWLWGCGPDGNAHTTSTQQLSPSAVRPSFGGTAQTLLARALATRRVERCRAPAEHMQGDKKGADVASSPFSLDRALYNMVTARLGLESGPVRLVARQELGIDKSLPPPIFCIFLAYGVVGGNVINK